MADIVLSDKAGDSISITAATSAPITLQDVSDGDISLNSTIAPNAPVTSVAGRIGDVTLGTSDILGLPRITVATAAPSSPSLNDIWINST